MGQKCCSNNATQEALATDAIAECDGDAPVLVDQGPTATPDKTGEANETAEPSLNLHEPPVDVEAPLDDRDI